ncbi:MAG: hypothetical protein HQK50_04970 [Oligoflexia bacterium]|nr:hypothetical protein [Oligoflexia bacterium]
MFIEVYFKGFDNNIREVDLPVLKGIKDCVDAISTTHNVDGSSLPGLGTIGESDIGVRPGREQVGMFEQSRRPFPTLYVFGGVVDRADAKAKKLQGLSDTEAKYIDGTDVVLLKEKVVNNESDAIDSSITDKVSKIMALKKSELHLAPRPYKDVAAAALEELTSAMGNSSTKLNIGPELEFFFVDKKDGKTPVQDGKIPYYGNIPVDMKSMMQAVLVKLKDLGVITEKFHHEVAEGQYEIPLKVTDALTQVENLNITQAVLEAAADVFGLKVIFDAKPWGDRNGSGMHIHMSVSKNGKNIFDPKSSDGSIPGYQSHCGETYSPQSEAMIASMIDNQISMQVLFNKVADAFCRLTANAETPREVAYGYCNRSVAGRIPDRISGAATRIENRTPSFDADKDLAIAYFALAFAEGIKNKTPSKPPVVGSAYEEGSVSELEKGADNLSEVVTNFMAGRKKRQQAAPNSLFEKVFTPEVMILYFEGMLKEAESESVAKSVNDHLIDPKIRENVAKQNLAAIPVLKNAIEELKMEKK